MGHLNYPAQYGEHQAIAWLQDRLRRSGRYRRLIPNMAWSRKGLNSEMDLYAETWGGDIHYYEVKHTYSREALKRAIHQAERARTAYSDRYLTTILVTPQRIHRLLREKRHLGNLL